MDNTTENHAGTLINEVKKQNEMNEKEKKPKDKKDKTKGEKGLIGDIKGLFKSSSSSEASLAGLNAALVHKLYDPKDLELQEDKGRRYSHRALHYLADKLDDADLCFMTMKPRGLPTDCTIKGNYVTVCRQNLILGPKDSDIEQVRLPVLKPERTQSDDDNLILLPGPSQKFATRLLVNRDNPEEYAEYLNAKIAWDAVRPDSPDSSEEDRQKKLRRDQRRLAKAREAHNAQYFEDLQRLGKGGSSSGEGDTEVLEEVLEGETNEEVPPVDEENKNPEEVTESENPEGENTENPEGENAENPEGELVENPEGDTAENPEGETGETAEGETGEKTEGETGETAEGETGEKAEGETGEKAEGETGEKAEEETGEKAEEETGEKGEGETGENADGDKPENAEGGDEENKDKPAQEGEDAEKGGAGDDMDGKGEPNAAAAEGDGKILDEATTEEIKPEESPAVELPAGGPPAEEQLDVEPPPPETEEPTEVPAELEENVDENNSWLGYQESDYLINSKKTTSSESKRRREEKEKEEVKKSQLSRVDPVMGMGMPMGMGMGGMMNPMMMGMNPMMMGIMNQMMMLTAMTAMTSMVSQLRPPPPPPPCYHPYCNPPPCDPYCYDNCCSPCYDYCATQCYPPMPCDYSFKKKCCKKSKKKKSKCHKHKTKERGKCGDHHSSTRPSKNEKNSTCVEEPSKKEEDMNFAFLPQKGCCAEVTMIMEPEEPEPLMYSIANGAMPVICCDMPPTLMMDEPCGYC